MIQYLRVFCHVGFFLSWFETVIAISEEEFPCPPSTSALRRLAECYQRALRPDWQWFESRMTYANAVLPHAMFIAAKRWPKENFLDIAQASFAFLDRQATAEGVFWPVGNEGWYPRGEEKASYDQQPVEAVTMTETAQAAFDLLGDEEYLAAFRRAYGWFHGRNSLKQPMVDVRSGACYDGLLASGVNRNQEAEATLAFLWADMYPFTGRCEIAEQSSHKVAFRSAKVALLSRSERRLFHPVNGYADMSNTDILHLYGDKPGAAVETSELA